MMNWDHPARRKNFDPIQEAYAFFLAHSTEAQNDLGAMEPYLQQVIKNQTSISILDFGCGDGQFLMSVLDKMSRSTQQIDVTLVEIADVARSKAKRLLESMPAVKVRSRTSLPTERGLGLDLIISNHALYYVPNLAHVLSTFKHLLNADGAMLLSMAGSRNVLIDIWSKGFALLGREIPYYVSENVATTLDELDMGFAVIDVPYVIHCEDSPGHRQHLLTFLFGEYLAQMHRGKAMALLNPYVRSGQLEISTSHELFVVTQ